MTILQQIAPVSCTLLPPPFPLLPPPRAYVEQKQRLALPAPKIAGYLPAPQVIAAIVPVKRVVEAEIVNPLILIDIRRDPKAFWAEFERIHGPDKTIEEMDAEIEAKHPGYLAWVARRKAAKS